MMIVIVFVVWLNSERPLVLFPAGTIVRDPHHCESDMPQAGFEPAQNLTSGLAYKLRKVLFSWGGLTFDGKGGILLEGSLMKSRIF